VDAVIGSHAEQWWAGRGLRRITAASSGHTVVSVDRTEQSPVDDDPNDDSNLTPFRKRKVAIWLGYVGTGYKGETKFYSIG
jgi:hypothetical protein